jgi:rubrerythrin
MSRTTENLKTAFAGESQANRKYTAYAEKAAADGFPNVAKLFRAAADAESIHAGRHWRALGMVRDTANNIEDALAGETYEVQQMYPPMLAQAVTDQEISAQHAFKGALEAEKVHMDLYAKALATVRNGKDLDEFRVYNCGACGYTHVGGPIDKCPVCNAGWSRFHEVA